MMRLGIIGWPLTHTLSPVIHRLLLDAEGLAGSYEVFPIEPSQWEPGMAALLSQPDLTGLNVTIPHKVSALQTVKKRGGFLTPAAEQVGAVNTLARDADGQWLGHNTDVEGFLAGLPEGLRHTLDTCHVMVLGAGGASRAVLAALLQAHVARLTLVCRDSERARETIEQFAPLFKADSDGRDTFHVVSWESFQDMPRETSLWQTLGLVVNTTPLGMKGKDEAQLPMPKEALAWLPEDALCYDLIYTPAPTQWLAAAQHAGLATQDGLPMLIGQALASFACWRQVPFAPERAEALGQLLARQLRAGLPT